MPLKLTNFTDPAVLNKWADGIEFQLANLKIPVPLKTNLPQFRTNNVINFKQNLVNLVAGNGISLTSDALGDTVISATSTAVGDGIIHGDAVWDVDDAVVWWRDDFIQADGASFTVGTIFRSQMSWVTLNGGGLAIVAKNQGPPYSGGLFLSNSATSNVFGGVVPASETNPGVITTANALFEQPNWKMVWNFSLIRGTQGAAAPAAAFSITQTSFYLGLANFPASTGTLTTPRPTVFVGLRFDTDTTAPSIGDTQFVFEAVCNTASLGGTTRVNTQGNTSATGIAPTEGHFYRLEALCTTAGSVKLTLIDSVLVAGLATPVANFSATLSIPTATYTSLQYSAANGMAAVAVNNVGFMPYSAGSRVTIAGTGQLGIDGTQTVVAIQSESGPGQALNFFDTTAVGLTTKTGATMTGFPAVYPWWSFGNDANSGSTTALNKAVILDYIAFAWNPGVGGGTGTPNPLKSRYF